MVWPGRDEDKDDDGVWAVTCFCVRKGYRGRGVTYPLAGPRPTTPGSWGDRGRGLSHGHPTLDRDHLGRGPRRDGQVFAEAGFTEVSAPTKRRRVMRIDFG